MTRTQQAVRTASECLRRFLNVAQLPDIFVLTWRAVTERDAEQPKKRAIGSSRGASCPYRLPGERTAARRHNSDKACGVGWLRPFHSTSRTACRSVQADAADGRNHGLPRPLPLSALSRFSTHSIFQTICETPTPSPIAPRPAPSHKSLPDCSVTSPDSRINSTPSG